MLSDELLKLLRIIKKFLAFQFIFIHILDYINSVTIGNKEYAEKERDLIETARDLKDYINTPEVSDFLNIDIRMKTRLLVPIDMLIEKEKTHTLAAEYLMLFREIIKGSYELFSSIVDKIDEKLEHFAEFEEIRISGTSKYISKFRKKCEEMQSKLSNPKSISYLSAASIDFEAAITEMFSAKVFLFSCFDSVDEKRIEDIKVHTISALYRARSAYEKIIYISNFEYNFGLDEKDLTVNKIIEKLKSAKKNDNLISYLESSDRRDIVQLANKIRGASIHRISDADIAEIEGYIYAFFKEAYEILSKY